MTHAEINQLPPHALLRSRSGAFFVLVEDRWVLSRYRIDRPHLSPQWWVHPDSVELLYYPDFDFERIA